MVSGVTTGPCVVKPASVNTMALATLRVCSVAESTGLREKELAWKRQEWIAIGCELPTDWIDSRARKWYDDTGQTSDAHVEMELSWSHNDQTVRYAVAFGPVVRVSVKALPVPGPDGEVAVSVGRERPAVDVAAMAELIAVRCAKAALGQCSYTLDRAAKEIGELGKYIRGGARSGAGEAQAGSGCPEGQWRG